MCVLSDLVLKALREGVWFSLSIEEETEAQKDERTCPE